MVRRGGGWDSRLASFCFTTLTISIANKENGMLKLIYRSS